MIYALITQGIAGTPMPGVEVSEAGSSRGLTRTQAWDLVNYGLSLSGSSGDANISTGTEAVSEDAGSVEQADASGEGDE